MEEEREIAFPLFLLQSLASDILSPPSSTNSARTMILVARSRRKKTREMGKIENFPGYNSDEIVSRPDVVFT